MTGSISFNLIPNMPIFVHFYRVFHKKEIAKMVSSKPDFYDAYGDEKSFYFFEWPKLDLAK